MNLCARVAGASPASFVVDFFHCTITTDDVVFAALHCRSHCCCAHDRIQIISYLRENHNNNNKQQNEPLKNAIALFVSYFA